MATFDINEVARRVQSVSTGGTAFTFNFQVNAASEVQVYVDDTLKQLTTHYTVALNADGTGTVNFGSATSSDELITIIGDQPLSRTTTFQVGQVNNPTTLETEFDNLTIRQQQLKEMMDRSIQLKPSTKRTVTGTGTSGPLHFPYDATASNNANKIVKFDSNGTALELGSTITNIDTVAGVSTEIALLGTSANVTAMGLLGTSAAVADMALLGSSDVIADMALLADSAVIADMAILATTDVVSDLNTLATSDIVTDINLLATSDIVSDLNTLATSAIVTDLSILATSDIVSDINTLATSDIVSDLNTLATSDFVSDLNTLASSTVVANIATVASNVAGVNSFAERYRVQSGVPASSNDTGDLVFDTAAAQLKVFDGSSYVLAGSSVNGTTARFQFDVTSSATTISGNDKNGETLAYDAGFVDVYLNGVKMVNGTDVTVTSGSSVVFGSAIGTSGTDTVDVIAYGTFNVASVATTAITSGTLGYARGGTGLGALGSADEVLQTNAGGTALEYGKVQAGNLDVAGNGTSGQMLTSDGDGTFSWADAAGASSYIGKNVQVFTSTGTFTVPTDVTALKVTVIGGGGAGEKVTAASKKARGGGAGGCAIEWLTSLTPGASIAVTIGAGGTAGGDSSTGDGGTSSFASYCSATGGQGGDTNANSPGEGNQEIGHTGGAGSGGTFNFDGGYGGINVRIGSKYYGGNGGYPYPMSHHIDGAVSFVSDNSSSGDYVGTYSASDDDKLEAYRQDFAMPQVLGGRAGKGERDGAGAAGAGYGTGGGGAGAESSGTKNGGAGAAGVVIVEW